jgi:hypothetical protein
MTPDDAISKKDALAAQMFPKQWAAIQGKANGSKRRAALRKRVDFEIAMRELRARGASCASCQHMSKRNYFRTETEQFMCDIGSDFYGEQITQPRSLCTSWKAREGEGDGE